MIQRAECNWNGGHVTFGEKIRQGYIYIYINSDIHARVPVIFFATLVALEMLKVSEAPTHTVFLVGECGSDQ